MLQEAQACSDAELVALCREGDREAFARVVERYQNLLCGLAYSLCGDVGRSEDFAQETFVVAWRKLAELDSPDRLKAWLCGILRNLSRNAARSSGRDPLTAATPLEHEIASGEEAAPAREAMSHEEQALLWTVLQSLPEVYREPLVLFYRSGDSTAEVAEALELSQEAVRQRLARGRALLGQRVTHLIESGLRSSNPTKAFTVAVMAALSTATSASAATTMATGTVTAMKQVGIITKASALGANLVGLLAGLVGLTGHVLNTRSRPERRFIAASAASLVICALLLVAGIALVYSRLRSGLEWADTVLLCLAWLAACGPLDALTCWIALRQKAIRARNKAQPDFPVETARRGYRISMYGAMISIAFGAVSWLMIIAAAARDVTALVLLLGAACTSSLLCAGWAVRRPSACAQCLVLLLWFLTLVTLAAVGLRWDDWAATQRLFPKTCGPVLLLIAVAAGSVRAGWFLKQRLLKSASVKRDSLIALATLAALLTMGFEAWRSVRSWEVSEIEDVQVLLSEMQADGSINFRSLNWSVVKSDTELRELRFVSSAPLSGLLDGQGRPLDLRVRREGDTFHFVAPFKEPIPPGGRIMTTALGQFPQKPEAQPGGIIELKQQHWPANGLRTLRAERYRLPPGSQWVNANLPNARSRRLGDGRLEIWVSKVIPAWGSLQFVLQFTMPD